MASSSNLKFVKIPAESIGFLIWLPITCFAGIKIAFPVIKKMSGGIDENPLENLEARSTTKNSFWPCDSWCRRVRGSPTDRTRRVLGDIGSRGESAEGWRPRSLKKTTPARLCHGVACALQGREKSNSVDAVTVRIYERIR